MLEIYKQLIKIFFNSIKKNSKVGYPKFHKKGRKDSYRTLHPTTIKFDVENHKLQLPKIGWIKYRDQRIPEGRIKNVTISKTKTGKFFASVLLEKEVEIKTFNLDEAIERGLQVKGLDMSLDKFYVDENNESPAFVRLFRKNESRIVYLQKQVSRKQKGSNNRYKAQLRVNKVYEKITNSRKDFIEKLSTGLIRNNDIIVLETLSLQGMSQALHLGKSVMDLGYSEFVKRLQDKAFDNGKQIIQADKWFASSKTCSNCGYINKDLKLSDREWICPNCGKHHNRDQNAALNSREYGLDLILNSGSPRPIVPVEMLTLVRSEKQESL